MSKPIEQTVESLIAPSLGAMGYEIVRIRLMGGDTKTLQIMAQRMSDQKLAVEDCEKISRSVSAILDVEDPIADAYHLEVSSPGIDRPLIKLKDFERYTGFDAKLTLKIPVNGRKRFTGTLKGVTAEEQILLQLTDAKEPAIIPLMSVDTAKLVLTDALIKAHQTQS